MEKTGQVVIYNRAALYDVQVRVRGRVTLNKLEHGRPSFFCQLEQQGKGLKYVSDRAKNAFELQTAPCNNCPVMPADWVQVTRDGHSVTSVDMVGPQ